MQSMRLIYSSRDQPGNPKENLPPPNINHLPGN